MFCRKHRLWVLVRTATETIFVLRKVLKISIFPGEFSDFYMSKNVCVLHGQVFAQAFEVITINHSNMPIYFRHGP